MASDKQQPIDYTAVIADLKAKRATIDQAIALMESIAQMQLPHSEKQPHASPHYEQIRVDTFFGLSIPAAARKYLLMKKEAQSNQQIAEALQRGGYKHQSTNFANTVGSVLTRESQTNKPQVVRVGRGLWGLPE